MGWFLLRIGISHHLFSTHRALWVQLFLNCWSLPGSGAGCLIEGFFIFCGHLTVFADSLSALCVDTETRTIYEYGAFCVFVLV